MKTLFKSFAQKSLVLVALATVAISSTSMATTTPSNKIYTVKNLKKIIIKGNVEVLLTQDNKETVNYQEDNFGKAKVTLEGNTLNITSTSKETVKILLSVKDIYRLDLSGGAIVTTNSTLNLKFLQVYVSDDSRADLSSNTEGLYTVLKDEAQLIINGKTDNHISSLNNRSKLDSQKLVSLNTTFINPNYVAKL